MDNAEKLMFKRRRVKKTVRKRANACVNILKQIGWLKPDQIEVCHYNTITFNPESFDSMVTEWHHRLRCRYNLDECSLVMGPAQWNQLIVGSNMNSFDYPMRFTSEQMGSRRFRGMAVIVLPWMDGITIVPKSYLPIETRVVEKEVPISREKLEGRAAAEAWNRFMGREPIP